MPSGSVVLTADWVGLWGGGLLGGSHPRGMARASCSAGQGSATRGAAGDIYTTPMGKFYDSGFHCVLFRFLRELVVRHSRVTSVPTASGTRGALGAEDGVLSLADSEGI